MLHSIFVYATIIEIKSSISLAYILVVTERADFMTIDQAEQIFTQESLLDCPLWEHNRNEPRNAMSRPLLTWNDNKLPHRCLLTFMNDVLEQYLSENHCEVVDIIHSETCDYPLYIATDAKGEFCLIHAPVGGPASAIEADLLIASGVEIIIACGGCGVLSPITQGKLLIASSALRDEGTSYHYLPPTREVALDSSLIALAKKTFSELNIPFEVIKTWTSDGFFRETPDLIDRRRAQGFDAVDMECASLAAVTKAYKCKFLEIFYSGDSLENSLKHNNRDWLSNMSARTAAFQAALEIIHVC